MKIQEIERLYSQVEHLQYLEKAVNEVKEGRDNWYALSLMLGLADLNIRFKEETIQHAEKKIEELKSIIESA